MQLETNTKACCSPLETPLWIYLLVKRHCDELETLKYYLLLGQSVLVVPQRASGSWRVEVPLRPPADIAAPMTQKRNQKRCFFTYVLVLHHALQTRTNLGWTVDDLLISQFDPLSGESCLPTALQRQKSKQQHLFNSSPQQNNKHTWE